MSYSLPRSPGREPLAWFSDPPPGGPASGSDLAIAGGRMNARFNYRVMVLLWLTLATAATFAAIARALQTAQFVY
jgi:hypothetical protein